MPREKLNFPSRSQRKALVETLRAQLNNNPQLAQDETYKAYVNSWVSLDQKMEALSAEDENGVPKILDDKDADDLAEAILATATAGEEYLAAAEYGGKAKDPVPQMVEQFQSELAKDFSAVKAYNPAVKQLSLAELQENARTRIIDLKGRDLGSMTNLQNERIPMSIINAKGEQRPGVFTKPTYVRVKGQYLDLIEKAKAACGDPNDPNPAKAEAAQQNRQKLDNYLNAFRMMQAGILSTQSGKKLSMNSSDDLTVGFLLRYLSNNVKGKMTQDRVREELGFVGIPDPTTIPKAALKILANGLSELKEDIPADLNAYQLELADGTRLDNRNVAMTAVSDAFDFGDLIARSESMKFIGENGETTEGTFMEYGKGVDLHRKPHLFEHVALNPYGDLANRNRLFKQISDIQVLDYLCLNKDRHPGNVFYEVDKEGKITGIQGIDNDSSFGPARWPKYEIGRLKVITKSTAEKIKAMAETPERLRFVLRGRGLTSAEISQAVGRLNDLQDGIEKGKVTVIADDQIGRRDIKDYYPKTDKNPDATNMFRMLDEYVMGKVKIYRDADKKFKPLPDQPKPTLSEVADADRRHTVAGLTDELGKVSRLVRNDEKKFNVDDLTTTFRGSSAQFRELVSEAKQASALQKRLLEDQNLNKSKLLSEDMADAAKKQKELQEDLLADPKEKAVPTLATVAESFQKLREKADAYLQYKFEHTKVRPRPKTMEELRGKNDYEQKHIDYARDILKAVADFEKVMSSHPETTADKENLQANQQRRELENRRAEAAKQPNNGPVMG